MGTADIRLSDPQCQSSKASQYTSPDKLAYGRYGSDDEVDYCGTNDIGNSSTRYANGSYHYDNLDGSKYDCDADGRGGLKSPDGLLYSSDDGSAGYGNYSDSDS